MVLRRAVVQLDVGRPHERVQEEEPEQDHHRYREQVVRPPFALQQPVHRNGDPADEGDRHGGDGGQLPPEPVGLLDLGAAVAEDLVGADRQVSEATTAAARHHQGDRESEKTAHTRDRAARGPRSVPGVSLPRPG